MADPFLKYLNKDEQNTLEGNKNPFDKAISLSSLKKITLVARNELIEYLISDAEA